LEGTFANLHKGQAKVVVVSMLRQAQQPQVFPELVEGNNMKKLQRFRWFRQAQPPASLVVVEPVETTIDKANEDGNFAKISYHNKLSH